MSYGNILEQDIQYLKGVGPVRAKLLQKELEVSTLEDLLYTFPHRYLDRSTVHRIADLEEDMPMVQIKGQILSFEKVTTGPHKRIAALFSDGTGVVEIVWFRSLKFVENTYKVHVPYLLFGKPTRFGNHLSFAHPEIEPLEKANVQQSPLQAIYHSTDAMKRAGITSKTIASLIENIFAALRHDVPETLTPALINAHHLMNLQQALHTIHFPQTSDALPAARRRVKFEELFYLQLDILRYAQQRKERTPGFVFQKVGTMFNRFYYEQLPFELTEAQKRVIREIRQDMRFGQQMNRLLQGDVGSGKTMVALMCCLLAVDNGFQACIMAPTEILAEQHLQTITRQLGSLPVKVALLTGNVTGKKRREILQETADGTIQILVGTHALIEPTVQFLNLGLAIIDEQHRFGVKQRAKLWQKNVKAPHVLVMTATPIPRTLAMTVYGDLDVSVIDQLPPGRKPIQTLHYFETDTARLYQGLRIELQRGRQAYIVYPLIEESEKSDLQSIEEGYATFTDAFPDFKVGMVHGRMKPALKDSVMAAFVNKEIDILISTTVIEVGVNVPNASVMVIEDADRFGLAQLHQLRGRVGRGAEQSYCILVTRRKLSDNTSRRMDIMVESTDGFYIAEEDMKLRGPGDLEGTQQSGIPFRLRLANVITDSVLMSEAREAAANILEADPHLEHENHRIIAQQLQKTMREKENFSDIS